MRSDRFELLGVIEDEEGFDILGDNGASGRISVDKTGKDSGSGQ